MQITTTVAFVLTLTVSLALRTDVIAKHCTEHEILFGSELVEGTCHNHSYGIKTLLPAEVKIQAFVANWLDDIFDVLAFQSTYGKVLIFLIESEEHHTAHSLLIFVDMVHQNLHVYG